MSFQDLFDVEIESLHIETMAYPDVSFVLKEWNFFDEKMKLIIEGMILRAEQYNEHPDRQLFEGGILMQIQQLGNYLRNEYPYTPQQLKEQRLQEVQEKVDNIIQQVQMIYQYDMVGLKKVTGEIEWMDYEDYKELFYQYEKEQERIFQEIKKQEEQLRLQEKKIESITTQVKYNAMEKVAEDVEQSVVKRGAKKLTQRQKAQLKAEQKQKQRQKQLQQIMERLEIYNNHVKLIEDVEQEKVRMKYTIDIAEPIEIQKEQYTFIGKGPSRVDPEQVNERLNLTSVRKRNQIYNDIVPEFSEKKFAPHSIDFSILRFSKDELFLLNNLAKDITEEQVNHLSYLRDNSGMFDIAAIEYYLDRLYKIMRPYIFNMLFGLSESQRELKFYGQDLWSEEDQRRIRIIISGIPLYTTQYLQYQSQMIRTQTTELFFEEMGKGYDMDLMRDTVIKYSYFLIGWQKQNEIDEECIRVQKQLRQKNINSKNQIKLLGFYNVRNAFNPQFIQRFKEYYANDKIPLKDYIDYFQLLSASGTRITIYAKFLKIMIYLFFQSDSVIFQNVFAFIQRQYTDGKLVVNPNPFMPITFMIKLLQRFYIQSFSELSASEQIIKDLTLHVDYEEDNQKEYVMTQQGLSNMYQYKTRIQNSDCELSLLGVGGIASIIQKAIESSGQLDAITFKIEYAFLKGKYNIVQGLNKAYTNYNVGWGSFIRSLTNKIRGLYNLSFQDFLQAFQQAYIESELKNYNSFLEQVQLSQYQDGYYLTKVFEEKQNYSRLFFSYMVGAALLLDVYLNKIQASLDLKFENLAKEQDAVEQQVEQQLPFDKLTASINSFTATVTTSDVPISYGFLANYLIMPFELWQEKCDKHYQLYDKLAAQHNIRCIFMLTWYIQTKQHLQQFFDENKIIFEIQEWMILHPDILEQCDKLETNSTQLISGLKQLLQFDNLYIVQYSAKIYQQNNNLKKESIRALKKSLYSDFQLILGIYYNHIFISNQVTVNTDINNKLSPSCITPSREKHNYPIQNHYIVFDIETTQIKDEKVHSLIPYMISYQYVQRNYLTSTIIEKKTYSILDGENFIRKCYDRWLFFITIAKMQKFYIISYNGCKFDLQYLYQSFLHYHSGSMKFFGTLLSPKYIEISYNDRIISVVDMRLILGYGSLEQWAKNMNIPGKQEYIPIYSLEQYIQLPIEQQNKITSYCEQDVELCSILYKTFQEKMGDLLKQLKLKVNDYGTDFLKPTLAAQAFSLWKQTLQWHINYEMNLANQRKIRQAYKGGFCCCYRVGRIQGDINYYDVNSLYPYVMTGIFPTNPPIYYSCFLENQDIINANIPKYTHLQIGAFKYKSGCKITLIPQKINNLTFYFSQGYDLQYSWITIEMLQLIFNDLEYIKVIGALKYNTQYQPIFQNYIKKMYDIRVAYKQDNKNLEAQRTKNLMNALYGKLAQQININEDMVASKYESIIAFSGAVDYQYNEYLDAYLLDIPSQEKGSLCYLALEIAARARMVLFQAIYNNKENVLYCDTDSMFILGQPQGIQIDDDVLGAWKNELKKVKCNSMFIFSPKVYSMTIFNENESVQMDVTNSEQYFNELEQSFNGEFKNQIIWSRKMGYVIQNRVNKKLEHRLRRFIEKDGSTRPFIDDKEFALYFRKTLRINDDNEFNYIDI